MQWDDPYDFNFELEASVYTEYPTSDTPTPPWHWKVHSNLLSVRSVASGTEPTYEKAKQVVEQILRDNIQELLGET